MTPYGRDPEESAGADPFARIDPRLTIFALANGMDLDKNGEVRRLEWYRDGHDRALLLSAENDGTISVTAQSWKRGDEASVRRAPVEQHVPVGEIVESLTALLERGREAANAL